MKLRILFALVTFALTIAVPALADTSATSSQPATSPLRVGVIAPMSGDFAKYGIGVTRAMQLANDTQPGRAITLMVEDNPTCQSAEAAAAFHKLVSIDRVELLVTFCTAAAQGVLGPATAQKIPVIQLTEPGPDTESYMIKMMPDSAPFVDHLAQALFRKYKKLAIVASTMEVNTGPRGNVPLFTKAFEKL